MALTFGAAASDRVDAASGNNNEHDFSIIIWHYPTTRTNSRRACDKSSEKEVYWGFGGAFADGFIFSIDRAVTQAEAREDLTYSMNTWYFSAFTYDGTDGPRIFRGTLSALATESPYSVARVVGSGAEVDDSGDNWVIGNLKAYTSAYQGRIALWAHYNTRLSLADIQAIQFTLWPLRDDLDLLFNFFGTGTQPDLGGSGLNGTVTGATASPHVPLRLARPRIHHFPTAITAVPILTTYGGYAQPIG